MEFRMTQKENFKYYSKVFYLFVFAAAMGYFESAVVVYLRELIYPEGFAFPLKTIPKGLLTVEVAREVATIIMLLTVAALAAKKFWERFGYFIFLFGVWDLTFYIWLKATINWPQSIFDWDILFLIPSPWIGPVAAPVLISILMVAVGLSITWLVYKGYRFRPAPVTWLMAAIGTAAILYSFLHDTDAALKQKMPLPYFYWLFGLGLMFYLAGYFITYLKVKKRGTY
jgi:hypothetical protein